MFGVDQLRALLLRGSKSSAAETLDEIFDAANSFANDKPQLDDMTAVLLVVKAA